MERETAGERGFRSIPALSRASDADEELAADALKGAGQPEPTVRDTCWRRMPPRSRRRISSAWQYRGGPTVAVHYGLKSMFQAQQVRSDRHRSVHATRTRRYDVLCPPSEYSIGY